MNRVIVITGGGGVLCSCIARALAETGAPVALIGRTYETVNRVASEINAAGGTARAYSADVLDKKSLEAAHAAILSDLGKCRVLINGAGGNSPLCTTDKEHYDTGDIDREDIKSFFSLDREGFDYVFGLNMTGTLLPTQVFVPDMRGEENCCVLNIVSVNSFLPLTKIPAYSSAKAAVTSFTKWLAVHFAEQGIRVNAIAPGFFVSKQNHSLLFNEDGTPTERIGKILAATPMKRFGKPEELIGTVKWLTDAGQSGFVTGITVAVDGGFTAYSGV